MDNIIEYNPKLWGAMRELKESINFSKDLSPVKFQKTIERETEAYNQLVKEYKH